MKALISIILLTYPMTCHAQYFLYDHYINQSILYAETQLNIMPYRHPTGESELENDEERFLFWSGWWHGMRQIQFQSVHFCD